MKLYAVFISVMLLICNSNCAKILGIFPVPAPSHYILGNSLMRGLAEKGHDVTLISSFVEKNPPKNGTYRDILLTGFEEASQRRRKDVNMFDNVGLNSFVSLAFMNYIVINLTRITLEHTNVQNLIHSNETFDVVIVEQFMNDALKAFAAHFNAPLVLLSTIGANAWVNVLVGNPAPPSYIPALFLKISSKMTFFERTVNSLMYIATEVLNYFYVFPAQKRLVDTYFPKEIDFYDVLYNASIVLVNSHPSTNQPVPYVPNMIDIGGFHVKPPKKLPSDLEEFLDNAKDGVIYFSLGSHLLSSDLPTEKREAFLKTFAKLKQKVLWKWEEDILPGQPENVKLGKWFPQQDILAHPNVKLFITHGGLLSTTETIYNGVPVLAIPIFGDQDLNAQNVVNSGYGLSLSYQEISEEALTDKLKQLLTGSEYADNAKRRSEIFHDRLNDPMETAIYWIEYVIKHRGAPHLKVAAVNLPLYQYFLLDVILFLTLLNVIGFYVFYKLVFLCCIKKRIEKLKQQ